ncbi:PucC family protein [Sphingomonas sp. SUN039]|uniref:PucC family protein n=1 Tax=Sphingomonas sp. SUN039 TaxID=2937787 RepID=UPI0021640761|nr:PucC family protein [Sphingomonas sp. SUN039]UVO54116.1 PucC family protein [Sphingomonas sp. SUN039]
MTAATRPSFWNRIGTRFLPFADAASAELPLSRLLRLSLFQISVGMCAVLLTGTLNRVMIVELGLHAWVVSAMVSLPLLFAPLRALIGHKSDHHRSVLGWKRVPYIWFGTMAQFGGLAIMPFALLVMTLDGNSAIVGQVGAAVAFLLVGAGMHTTQTAGLALATDLADEDTAPRVVALLYVMLLVGMMVSALVMGRVLIDYTPTRLAQVVQGAAVLTVIFNVIALWKQEARSRVRSTVPAPAFSAEWQRFIREGRNLRLLVAVGLGAAAFAMQDVLLEPYGGQMLHLSVGATTSLTALWATGTLLAFALAARALGGGGEPHRLAGFGCVAGIAAFAMIIFAAPAQNAALLGIGAALMGFGGGLFSVGTLTATMALSQDGKRSGLALGAWGAVQASCAGSAILLGGLVRDALGASGYATVYTAEIVLLIATLIAVGPLVRPASEKSLRTNRPFGLAEFPA